MSGAFQDFASGKFREGLAKLDACEYWRDGRTDLDGPFYLGFPQKSGWGEGLLIASLLKRHCKYHGRRVNAFAHKSVCSILANDASFEVLGLEDQDFRSCGARAPSAVLRASLADHLLSLPFVPIASGAATFGMKPSIPRIGVAWASVDDGEDISAKSIPFDDFLSIIFDLDGEIVSFQRAKPEDKKRLKRTFGDRCSALCDDELDAIDQTAVVRAVRALSCMVTVSTTTAHVAACFGIPVVLLAKRRGGPQWFWSAQADYKKCFYPTVDVILGAGGDGSLRWWEDCIERARRCLSSALRNRRD